MENMVLAHVAWMDWYTGDVDTIWRARWRWDQSGHLAERSGEQFNFFPIDGEVRGYVARFSSSGFKQMDISRLGATHDAAKHKPLTVIWTATPPDNGDRVIVGWYRGATAYREPFERANPKGTDRYYFSAKPSQCFRLPPPDRLGRLGFRIQTARKANGGGGPGNDTLFYPDDNAPDLAHRIRKYITEKSRSTPSITKAIPINEGTSRTSVAPHQSRQTDIETRLAVEKAAMDAVKQALAKNWICEDVSAKCDGWDITATQRGGTQRLLIEVKGLSGSTAVVELTPNEYAKLRQHGPGRRDIRYIVAIMTEALSPRLHKLTFFGAKNGKWMPVNPVNGGWTMGPSSELDIMPLIAARLTVVASV